MGAMEVTEACSHHKAFLHWYTGEGMAEMEFTEAHPHCKAFLHWYTGKSIFPVLLTSNWLSENVR
jgi:hypothetical protein